ncbi:MULTISPECIES: hypothetical protein [Micromonospora]|nr:hypothetical protein [Micromonospora provocatoris]
MQEQKSYTVPTPVRIPLAGRHVGPELGGDTSRQDANHNLAAHLVAGT